MLDSCRRIGHTGQCGPRTRRGRCAGLEEVDEPMTDQHKGRIFARQRRANAPGGRQHAHKVKVTPEEEGQLLRLAAAQHVTIPRLLVESALAAEAGETVTERRALMTELFSVYRLLGAVSNNVNQIAKATNATGEWQRETAATLAKVRQIAERIDVAIDGLIPS